MTFKELVNGDLYAVGEGEPPPAPPGYEMRHPFYYVRKLLPCKFRTTRKSKCCNNAERMFCEHFNKTINRRTCQECKIPE